MPVPSSVNAKLNAIRFNELLGSGCVEASKPLGMVGAGNLASRVKVAFAAVTFKGYE